MTARSHRRQTAGSPTCRRLPTGHLMLALTVFCACSLGFPIDVLNVEAELHDVVAVRVRGRGRRGRRKRKSECIVQIKEMEAS